MVHAPQMVVHLLGLLSLPGAHMWGRLLNTAGQGPRAAGGHWASCSSAPGAGGRLPPFTEERRAAPVRTLEGGGGQEAAVRPDLRAGPLPSLLTPGGPVGWGGQCLPGGVSGGGR